MPTAASNSLRREKQAIVRVVGKKKSLKILKLKNTE